MKLRDALPKLGHWDKDLACRSRLMARAWNARPLEEIPDNEMAGLCRLKETGRTRAFWKAVPRYARPDPLQSELAEPPGWKAFAAWRPSWWRDGRSAGFGARLSRRTTPGS